MANNTLFYSHLPQLTSPLGTDSPQAGYTDHSRAFPSQCRVVAGLSPLLLMCRACAQAQENPGLHGSGTPQPQDTSLRLSTPRLRCRHEGLDPARTYLVIYQELRSLEVPRSHPHVVLLAGVVELRQPPVDQAQLEDKRREHISMGTRRPQTPTSPAALQGFAAGASRGGCDTTVQGVWRGILLPCGIADAPPAPSPGRRGCDACPAPSPTTTACFGLGLCVSPRFFGSFLQLVRIALNSRGLAALPSFAH